MMILKGEWDRDALGKMRGDEQERADAADVVERCLDMDAETRCCISGILESRWFRGCVNDVDDDDHDRVKWK